MTALLHRVAVISVFYGLSSADAVTGNKASQRKADHSYYVNYIHWPSPPFSRFLYLIGGSQSLRRGLTAYRSKVAPKIILTS